MGTRRVSFDFDREVERAGSASVKHDGRAAYFGSPDVLPLWVADMDFAAPAAVTQALQRRAAHPVYGYTLFPDSLYDALIAWFEKRHGWQIEREWIVLCPGVVPSLHAAVLAYTEPGQGVIVQPPVYFPFLSCAATTGRTLVQNPLKLENGRYRMDFDHLERCAASGARLLLLCSPHNPVGRVWEREELEQVLAIARRHRMTVLSDEIHADLVYPGERHRVLATLAGEHDAIVTAVAPSKTFNIPGLGLSALVVPQPERRAALHKVFDLLHVSAANPFSIAAFEAAYRGGELWLDALLAYLDGTRQAVRQFLIERLPVIRLIEPEGTYLLWLDCRALGLDDKELKRFFVYQSKVGMNPGTVFGAGGNGFMRMNIGTPRRVVLQALQQIEQALAAR